jgi:hypothetical protein
MWPLCSLTLVSISLLIQVITASPVVRVENFSSVAHLEKRLDLIPFESPFYLDFEAKKESFV